MRTKLFSWMACPLFFLGGCGEMLEKTEMVPLDKLPPAVMKTAQEKLPDVKFENAWKEKGGYEVRGKSAGGKVRDIRVSETGEVLEID